MTSLALSPFASGLPKTLVSLSSAIDGRYFVGETYDWQLMSKKPVFLFPGTILNRLLTRVLGSCSSIWSYRLLMSISIPTTFLALPTFEVVVETASPFMEAATLNTDLDRTD